MSGQNNFYEISGEGFGSVRDLCDSLTRYLVAEGVGVAGCVKDVNMDGTPATRNRAVGVVYLRDGQQNNQAKLDVILYRATVGEGDVFLDYRFQRAIVRPENGVDLGKLETAVTKVLEEQKPKIRPRKKLATASSAPNPDF